MTHLKDKINKKLFIFDLDGTLIDSYEAIKKSLNSTLIKLGYRKVNLEKVKKNVGRGDRIFIETFFPKKDIKKALELYRNYHRKDLLLYTKLRPYAKKLLSTLKHKNKIIAIASNRPRYFTNIILKKLNIASYLDIVCCADEIRSLKPNPRILKIILKKANIEKENALYIGDMDIDLETAKRAKIEVVFLEGGSTSLEEVKKYKDKKIAHSLKDILRFYK